jgi:hypothetical protein
LFHESIEIEEVQPTNLPVVGETHFVGDRLIQPYARDEHHELYCSSDYLHIRIRVRFVFIPGIGN